MEEFNLSQINIYSIDELVEYIISGSTTKEQLYKNGLFRPNRPLLEKALEVREEDDWHNAETAGTPNAISDYLNQYDKEEPYYRGKHVDEAKEIYRTPINEDEEPVEIDELISISEIENEDNKAELSNLLSSLIINSQKRELAQSDNEAWLKATSKNTIYSYEDYLRVYKNNPWGYAGKHNDHAKKKILQLQEAIDWLQTSASKTRVAYKKYISKYEPIKHLLELNHIDEAKKLLSEPTPTPFKRWIKKAIGFVIVCIIGCLGICVYKYIKGKEYNHDEKLSAAECYRIGMMYLENDNYGNNCDDEYINYEKAIHYLTLASDSNHVEATKELGAIYKGVYNSDMPSTFKVDGAKAIKYYEKAIQLGDKDSYGELIDIYFAGNGIWSNADSLLVNRVRYLNNKGISYLWIDPELSHVDMGIPRNYTKIKEIANILDNNALKGLINEFGIGQAKDLEKAYHFYSLVPEHSKEYVMFFLVDQFRTPVNLSLVCEGNRYPVAYIPYEIWTKLGSQWQKEFQKIGIYVNDSGIGKCYVINLFDEAGQYTWQDANFKFGTNLPPKDTRYWFIYDEVNPVITKFGGSPLKEEPYWSSTKDRFFYANNGVGCSDDKFRANIRLVRYDVR